MEVKLEVFYLKNISSSTKKNVTRRYIRCIKNSLIIQLSEKRQKYFLFFSENDFLPEEITCSRSFPFLTVLFPSFLKFNKPNMSIKNALFGTGFS